MANNTPFIRNEVPMTQSRLKYMIKVKASYGGYIPDPTNKFPILPNMVTIGALTKISYDSPRGATERRELNYDTMGLIQEMVPGLVSYDVTIEGIYTYAASVMEAMGFGGSDTVNQTRPVMLHLELPSPANTNLPTKTIVLTDCWLASNPAAFDVEGKDDMRITQSIKIHCGGMKEI